MSNPGTGKVLNLYCENPNKIALCIYVNDNDLLQARAIVWNLDDGRVFMDRIYSNTYDQKQALLQFAKENGMITRDTGGLGQAEVTLPKDYGQKHRPSSGNPYMDTFRLACVDKNGRYFLANYQPNNIQNYRNVYGLLKQKKDSILSLFFVFDIGCGIFYIYYKIFLCMYMYI